MPFVLHAAWLRTEKPFPNGRLFLWADESNHPLWVDTVVSTEVDSAHSPAFRIRHTKVLSHPGQISAGQLRSHLLATFPTLETNTSALHSTTVWLPSQANTTLPRQQQDVSSVTAATSAVTTMSSINRATTVLAEWQVTGVTLSPIAALRFLSHLNHGDEPVKKSTAASHNAEQQTNRTLFSPLRFATDLLFWSNAAKYVLQLLVGQHYIPAFVSQGATQFYANWQPIFTDTLIETQFEQLAQIMPAACRAYGLSNLSDAPAPQELLNHFVTTLTDAAIRHWGAEQIPAVSPHSYAQQWLQGLLQEHRALDLPPQIAHAIYQTWRSWSEQLYITRDANFRLCFKLMPPELDDGSDTESVATKCPNADSAPAVQIDPENWTLYYYLQARDHLNLMLPASAVWEAQNHTLHLGSRLLDRPKERLLASLTLAARISPPITRSLRSPQPTLVHLTTAEAYTFLNETAPLLENSGFGLILPDWWYTNQRVRLGLRLRLQAAAGEPEDDTNISRTLSHRHRGKGNAVGPSHIHYDWELTLGDKSLLQSEFEQLTALDTPLVRLHGQWIELDPQQVAAAQQFLADQQTSGRIPFLQALRIAQSHLGRVSLANTTTDVATEATSGQSGESANPLFHTAHGDDLAHTIVDETSNGVLDGLLAKELPNLLPIYHVDVHDWFAQALNNLHHSHAFVELSEPEGFVGELRPYQRRGVSWLSYLGQLGLGACLADDMGLGKTIQSIALLLYQQAEQADVHSPSLLLCPTSVVANWRREVERFAPTLRTLVHHGSGRLTGETFTEALPHYDLILTSYGTARRDMDLLGTVVWAYLILDEAQNIKNPSAKQTQAVRQFRAENRLALTGTPIENRLAELWSIIEFLNPGYLDGYERFRRRYVIPIERYNDEQKAIELRDLVQPFLLRRLKSDPTILADLPEKNEMVVYCSLTQEQTTLYETVVRQSLAVLDQSDGIQRRGMVLALLTKLKQITNHPAHYLKEEGPLDGRSGKLNRLTEMMEEVLAVGDSALVFTQFVEMGQLLQRHLVDTLKADVLFLHGRTSAAQREQMVQAFQESENSMVFILSLRAGGAGLNLTRANHVFHYDRWWNPAVENQATDRAFRIGQRRNVQVHKFVVAGTLEEHIQQLLEDKQNLADTVVGSGEQWLSSLNTDQLRELLLLHPTSDS